MKKIKEVAETTAEREQRSRLAGEAFDQKPNTTKLIDTAEKAAKGWKAKKKDAKAAFRAIFVATYRVVLAAEKSKSLRLELRERCKAKGHEIHKTTPLSTIAVKALMTDSRTLAHKHSTAMRGGILGDHLPDDLEETFGTKGGPTLKSLIADFAEAQKDGEEPGPLPVPAWSPEARNKYADLADHDGPLYTRIETDAKGKRVIVKVAKTTKAIKQLDE